MNIKYFVFLTTLLFYACNDNASGNASKNSTLDQKAAVQNKPKNAKEKWKKTFAAELNLLGKLNINVPKNQCECDQIRLNALNKWQKDKNHGLKNKIFSIFSKICKVLPAKKNCAYSQKLKEKKAELTLVRKNKKKKKKR